MEEMPRAEIFGTEFLCVSVSYANGQSGILHVGKLCFVTADPFF